MYLYCIRCHFIFQIRFHLPHLESLALLQSMLPQVWKEEIVFFSQLCPCPSPFISFYLLEKGRINKCLEINTLYFIIPEGLCREENKCHMYNLQHLTCYTELIHITYHIIYQIGPGYLLITSLIAYHSAMSIEPQFNLLIITQAHYPDKVFTTHT